VDWLPAVGWNRERQVVANGAEGGRPLLRKCLRDATIDGISGKTGNERHQQQAQHRGTISK
jgi:hypothetical protein